MTGKMKDEMIETVVWEVRKDLDLLAIFHLVLMDCVDIRSILLRVVLVRFL